MRKRIEEIHQKGFDIISRRDEIDFDSIGNNRLTNFKSVKVGSKTLDDAVLRLGDLRKVNSDLADKHKILQAISNYDLKEMRRISDFFYKISGIYSRIIKYMAFMYRYDWFVTPYVNDKNLKPEKILKGFHGCLDTLDDFGVKKVLGEIALKVLLNGVYYGYKVKNKDGSIVLQELPPDYCRSRYNYGQKPAVEFNMKFFDEQFRDATQKMKILKMFPDEFKKGYILYKEGKLKGDFVGDTMGWYLLNPENTERFTLNGDEHPPFISTIPLIVDLDVAQGLDRKKSLQRLYKIIVQKLPLDKNGDLIFDVDEARDLHLSAKQMLQDSIGVEVFTTFADTQVEDLESSKAQSQTDDLSRVERQLYNEAGVSQMQFNTSGNLALEKSILNDEISIYNMLLQFEQFLNELIEPYNTNKKKVRYKVQILTTTIYNYKELAKLYKEQTQLGYSKVLPQIALGQSQSSILANAYFENDVLDLVNVFIPPLMSSTMNGDFLTNRNNNNVNNDSKESGEGAGRKELADDKKSEKTIMNRESMT